jgi:hypothetical protein
MFDRYNKQGEMYIILPKKPAHTGEKYQFHFQTKQFMDEKDHRANLTELRARWPQLADIFRMQARLHNILALDPDITDLPAMMQQALPMFSKILVDLILDDAPMTIEGEINAMMQKLIPQAFAEAINAVKRSR